MKKQLLLLASSLAVAGASAGLSSAAMASAQSTTAPTTKPAPARLHARVRLNQAVRDGTITSTQKTALTAELKTLRQERKAAVSKSSTKAERQAERTKLKSELQAWASTNNFPLAKIFPKLGA